MTPNKQLIFETREEAEKFWYRIMEWEHTKQLSFTRWLSQQNVIIKSEVKE